MRQRNQSLWQRITGPSSISYRDELRRRRKETAKAARLEAAREKEAEREQIRRERQRIRDANKLKRELLKEEQAERRAELARKETERREKTEAAKVPSAAAIERAYKAGARTLSEAMEMETRRNPRGTKGKFQRCVEAVESRGGAYDPQAVCSAQERHKYGQKELTRRALAGKQAKKRGNPQNPADEAMAVSEEFHGRKVKAMVPIQVKRHYHKYLAELGELRKLVVECGRNRVTLSNFDGALLCCNEDKNQLFIVGGDQSVNLADFGIRNPHETETLGEVSKIEYFTDKEHLGSEGGTAVYVHKFRTTNENGQHKTVRTASCPELIYHLRDERLEFAGGSYEIRAEGIDL